MNYLDSMEPVECGPVDPRWTQKVLEVTVRSPWPPEAIEKARKCRKMVRAVEAAQEQLGPESTGRWGFSWDLVVPGEVTSVIFRRRPALGQKGEWRCRLFLADEPVAGWGYATRRVREAVKGVSSPTHQQDLYLLTRPPGHHLVQVFEARAPGRRKDSRPWREEMRRAIRPDLRVSNAVWRVALWTEEA